MGSSLSVSADTAREIAVMGSYASKNRLSVEDMTFLQAKTQLDQASIQGWYEGFLKDCPSGELTKEQFVEMYPRSSQVGMLTTSVKTSSEPSTQTTAAPLTSESSCWPSMPRPTGPQRRSSHGRSGCTTWTEMAALTSMK